MFFIDVVYSAKIDPGIAGQVLQHGTIWHYMCTIEENNAGEIGLLQLKYVLGIMQNVGKSAQPTVHEHQ